jgi:PhzF family phenazine biosynthesis protein
VNYYIADAFTDGPFTGNPAGVCILGAPLPQDTMQRIANENNLSETAFIVPNGEEYGLRWFTPVTEINLAGHPTLASAFVLHEVLGQNRAVYRFHTESGPLEVTPRGDLYEMDFPAWPARQVEITPEMRRAVGGILEAHLNRDLFLVLKDEAAVREYQPDFTALAAVPDCFGLAITAKGDTADFVSRMFGPNVGIPEDPVTGSIHSTLIPFWAARLGKDTLLAKQLSPRGGTLYCENRGKRVRIAGRARLYLKGELFV